MFFTGRCLGDAGAWGSQLHPVLCQPPVYPHPGPRTVGLSPHLPLSNAPFGPAAPWGGQWGDTEPCDWEGGAQPHKSNPGRPRLVLLYQTRERPAHRQRAIPV